MFTVGRAARGRKNLGQKKVTKLENGQFSKRNQISAIFGLLKLFRSEVKCSFCKKIKQHNSLGRYDYLKYDYLKECSDLTQLGKYHLSTLSRSWQESRCVNVTRASVNCAAAGHVFISKECSVLSLWKAEGSGGRFRYV